MYLMENIRLALEGLKSNKMRAVLTMLGIIIGISSVIAIVTVGDAMTATISNNMAELGATNITLSIREKEGDNNMFSASSGGTEIKENDLITDEMIETYIEVYGNDIDAISLSASGGAGKAKDGRLYANINLIGVNDGYFDASNVDMMEGRVFRENDIKSKRYGAVVSDKLVNNMYPKGTDPLGKEIKVSVDNSLQTFTIVGVYEYSPISMMFGDTASEKDIYTNLYIPITTCTKIMSLDKGYRSVTVKAKEGVDITTFMEDSEELFNRFYVNNTKYEISSTSMESMISSVTEMTGTISVAVSVIAAISLLVGGVGVMNIMLVSVTERTREIGTRKALGARSAAIRIQFVVEAVIICSLGGIIGLVLGISLGYLGSSLMGFPGFPQISIMVIAILFSMLIGIFFGYYPANKAANLDPIEALRYE